MNSLEGRSRSLGHSFGIIVQSLTTTGYGQDAPWHTTFLEMLMIVAQFTGITYLFFAFPLFVGPWIRDAVAGANVPGALEAADDHVVICGYSLLCASLVEDLEARDQPYTIVEDDEEMAATLYEKGYSVVHGDIGTAETLRQVNVEDAIAVVITSQQTDVIGTILTLTEANPDLEVICLIDDPEQSQYLRFAGATTVLSPKHQLGKSIADKTQNVISADLEDHEDFEIDVEIAEFPVTRESPVCDRQLTELDTLEQTDATLVGAWLRGEFVTTQSTDDRVDENTVLVVAGTESQLENVEQILGSDGRSPTAGPVLIAGHGTVGMTAEGILRKAGQETRVIDTDEKEGVDVVGSATDGAILDEAGIGRAETVILALPDDEEMLLATLVARHANPDVEIIAAANDSSSTSKLYSAGADYVLALPKVAARITILQLFDEDAITLREQIQLTLLQAPALEGTHPADEALSRETDSVIIGVQRNDTIVTDFDAEFALRDDDEILVAGTERGVSQFRAEFAE